MTERDDKVQELTAAAEAALKKDPTGKYEFEDIKSTRKKLEEFEYIDEYPQLYYLISRLYNLFLENDSYHAYYRSDFKEGARYLHLAKNKGVEIPDYKERIDATTLQFLIQLRRKNYKEIYDEFVEFNRYVYGDYGEEQLKDFVNEEFQYYARKLDDYIDMHNGVSDENNTFLNNRDPRAVIPLHYHLNLLRASAEFGENILSQYLLMMAYYHNDGIRNNAIIAYYWTLRNYDAASEAKFGILFPDFDEFREACVKTLKEKYPTERKFKRAIKTLISYCKKGTKHIPKDEETAARVKKMYNL